MNTLTDQDRNNFLHVPEPITLNRTVQNIRRQLGLSQQELAALLGVDFAWLSKLECCRLPIPPHNEEITALLPTLASISDLDLEWLQSLQMTYRPGSGEPPAFIEYLWERR